MVRGADGRVFGVEGVVSFTGITRTRAAVVLTGVTVLNGEVTAQRIVAPLHGFTGARIDGLFIDGIARPAAPNSVYPLSHGGYLVALQEAVNGNEAGLVGLRIHTDRPLGESRAGGDVLIGVPNEGRGDIPVLALDRVPAPPAAPGYVYPLASRGVIVGCPFVPGSTHSPTAPPDNLASDNAVDLAVPLGTPVLAVADGTIGPLLGPLDSHDPHMAGLRLHLDTPNRRFYYAHLSRIDVTPGQEVHQGQQIGLTGEAAGVPHLHFAQDTGNPADTIGQGASCPDLPFVAEPWG
jgi:hypothetical protein